MFYTKESIKDYTNFLWTSHVKEKVSLESEVAEEIENGILRIQKLTSKHLFPRNSSRLVDTKMLSLIHGSNTDFKKFKRSIKKKGSPLCATCNSPDDAYHRLYECPKFDCEQREHLPVCRYRESHGLKLVLTPGSQHLISLRTMAKNIFKLNN